MRSIGLTIVAAFVFALAGCAKDSWDKVDTERIAAMREMVSILQGVKDEASAKAAAEKLKAIVPRLKALQQRANKLGMPDMATAKAIMQKHGANLEKMNADLKAESMRIQANDAWAKHLDAVMIEISGIKTDLK